jgi:hypothetical protein
VGAGLTAFALLQLGLAAAVELDPPQLGDPSYGLRLAGLERRAAGAPRPLTAVMVGSSRTLCGLRDRDLDAPLGRALGRPAAVANFGVSGGGPFNELLTYRRLRRDGVRPDLLLVEVLPAFFSRSFGVDEVDELHLPPARLRRGDLGLAKRYAAGRRPGLRRAWRLSQLTAACSRRRELVTNVCPDLLPTDLLPEDVRCLDAVLAGPPPAAGRTPELRARLREGARREYAAVLADFRLGGRGCTALRELLADCRRDRVPAALVVMPEGSEFRSWYGPAARVQLRDWLQAQSAEFGAAFVDAREWCADDDFIDGHHLYGPGAIHFTERLGREVILPRLRATGAP